ncbi:hypothetical protein KPL71_000705 [Citrus sinensis]|uniref:Uncharacterized protein n=1 Tax=Citrus sinensis TaxID=2711 RepID=A0ACB8NRT8_CITSI|nr:hypothetical protein KPL71_000705 [Citrus sinensis]
MYCQLAPGGYVAACTHTRDKFVNQFANYLIWRSQVLASIRGNRLEKFIDETVTPPPSHIAQRIDNELRSVENPDSSSWKAQDQVLLGWLLSLMSEGIISLVFNLKTSLEVWKAIETQFGSQSKSRLLHLRYLMNSTRKDDLKINEYFIKMKNFTDNMTAAGSALSSDDLILHVLSGLGPDYNVVATYITGQISSDKMNLNEAYAMLLTQEARIEQQAHMLSGMDVKHNFEANLALSRGFKKGNFSGGRGAGNQNYFTGLDNAGNFGNNYRGGYGRSGFFSNSSGNNHNNQFRGFQGDNQRGSGLGNWNNGGGVEEFFTSGAYKPPPNRNPKAAYLSDMDGAADANWYLDSGATHHLTNDMRNMTMAESFAGNSKLIIGNGTGLHITNVGNVVFRMHNSSAHNTLELNNMLLVPQIYKNLISISQLTKDNNIVIEFTDKSCFVKDKVMNLIILQGKAEKVRTILSLAVMKGWKVRQIDINNAFLNGDISEDLYMTQPEGFITKEGYVCKLSKALYGLKQAPRAWYDKLKGCLTSWNFFNSKADTSLFIRHDTRGIILVLIYVDDILITGPDSSLLETFITKFSKVFALKDLGLVSYFLGVENYKGSDTPLSTGQKLENVAKGCLGKEFEYPTLYRSIVGGLQYLILTRPDIAHSVHKLDQYLSAPTLQHWFSCKKMQIGLVIQMIEKSIGAYCIYLGNNLISWSSKKQAIVVKSSTESEYRALSSASSETSWLESLFSELNIVKLPTPVLWCDNQSAGELAKNPVFHSKSKHIELDIHYIRDKVLQKQLEVRYILIDEQVADILTKALSLPKFSYFRSKLNVISRPLSLRGDVKEAHICSQAEDHRAEDHSSLYNQLQVYDMYCQLAPGGYVAACTHTRDNTTGSDTTWPIVVNKIELNEIAKEEIQPTEMKEAQPLNETVKP